MKRLNLINSGLNEKTKKELIDILFAYQQAIDINIISSITDTEGKILYVNDIFCEVSKYSRKELLGKSHNIINSGFHPKTFFEKMWKTLKRGEVWHDEIKNKAKDGTLYWVDTVILPILNKNKEVTQYLSLRILITEKKIAEEERKEYTNKLKEMLDMTSHSVRRPLANCLGLMSQIEENEPLEQEELKKIVSYLKQSALELDIFTKDLTSFMNNLDKKYNRK